MEWRGNNTTLLSPPCNDNEFNNKSDTTNMLPIYQVNHYIIIMTIRFYTYGFVCEIVVKLSRRHKQYICQHKIT